MGIDFILRISAKIIFFAIFIGLANYIIIFMFNFLSTYGATLPIGAAFVQLAAYFGVLSGLALYINIIVTGYLIKLAMKYWSTI